MFYVILMMRCCEFLAAELVQELDGLHQTGLHLRKYVLTII